MAFVVNSRQPGPITFAIAHREGEMRIVDLVHDGLTVQQAIDLGQAYGIDKFVGGVEEDGQTHAHAVFGTIYLFRDADG